MSYRILFSNIGYARGIDGSLRHHINFFGRHFYTGTSVQEQVLAQLKAIIDAESPDLCCFVEIDQGSFHSARFNQIEALMDTRYRFHDIADKYGENSRLGRMPLHRGKSNAFMAREELKFERLYFRHGSKRLIYALALPGGVQVLFAHFSLNKKVRALQFEEARELLRQRPGEVIILADFNVMKGLGELEPLLKDGALRLMNREEEHTFRFHRRKLVLDLCLCSPGLAGRVDLRVIPQPFSDHAALLVDVAAG